MKKDDFTETIEKMIANRQQTTAGIQADIATLDAQISDYQAKINAYTNVNDVKTYADLKNNLEVRQHKRDALKRELSALTAEQDEKEIIATINGFCTERRKLDDAYAADMLDTIRRLAGILDEAEARRASIKNLFDRWTEIYSINTAKYQSFPTIDETGITLKVQQLIKPLKALGKL